MHISIAFFAFSIVPLVAGHCKITNASGDQGGKGTALGITADDGNSQSDVTVFQGSQAKSFGETPGAGNIDPTQALPAAMKLAGNKLPQVSTGGTVTMTLHQINGDGAGPMACSVDPTAKGDSFQDMTISTNVPGNNGRSDAADQDFPLVAQMPAGVACTGTVAGQNNLCMVKCQNPAGPFGGVVAVQSGAGTSETTNTTASSGNNAIGSSGNSTTNAGGNAGGKKGNGRGKKGNGRKGHKDHKHRIPNFD